MRKLSTVIALAMLTSLVGLASPASAQSTHWVNDDVPVDGNTSCIDPGFNTIQAAVTASANGDTINVCSGTYDEVGQIVISHDLTIEGDSVTKPLIRPTQNTSSSGDGRGFFLVNPGVNLDLSNVVIDGDGFSVWQAIRHLGTGTASEVDFRNIRFGTYNGTALAAFGNGNVDVFNSTFEQIGRIGVHYFGPGITDSTFDGNTYVGKGEGDQIDNGLDVGAGAVVTISNNHISGNRGVASSDGSGSTGILVTTFFGPGTEATILDNVLTDNGTAIAQGFNAADTSEVEAHGNDIMGNAFGYVNRSDSVTADATNNYWGHPSGPGGDDGRTNPAGKTVGKGDAIRGLVDFVPWLRR